MIGRIFCPEGTYSSVNPKALLNKEVEKGEFLVAEDLLFQVEDVWYERQSYPGEDRILSKGHKSSLNPEVVRYARLRLLGRLVDGDLKEYFGPIKPMMELKRATEDEIKAILGVNKGIKIGKTVQGKVNVYLDIETAFRQGLLVVGSVGTGKTTTMLTILCRLIELMEKEGSHPRILIIDKDGEYGNIRKCAENIQVREPEIPHVMDLDKLAKALKIDKKSELYKKLSEVKEGPIDREILGAHYDNLPKEIYVSISNTKLDSYLQEGVTLISLRKCVDTEACGRFIARLLARAYERALEEENFGLLLVIDEVHLFVPEKGGISLFEGSAKELREVLNLIATTGARNGITLFAATQRPSLVGKAFTTQLGMNIISHRVTDVDAERIKDMMGNQAANMVRNLQRGHALVLFSSMRIPATLRVAIDKVVEPRSSGKTALNRWRP